MIQPDHQASAAAVPGATAPTYLGVEFLRKLTMEVIIMSAFSKTLVFSVLFLVVPIVVAEG